MSSPPPRPVFQPLRDAESAWRELAGLWSAKVEAADACAALARVQLQCFNRKLTLATIRQMGRPGILTLDGPGGRPAHVLLVGLSDTAATLRAGGAEQVVPLADLATRWEGEFATLWRVAPGYADAADAKTASAVQLQWAARDLPALRTASTGDGTLREHLRAFQRSQGLPADGRPGPLTFMQLNRVAGVAEPRLRSDF